MRACLFVPPYVFLAWLAVSLLRPSSSAQDATEVIPIHVYREGYVIPSEDGKGQSCGAELKGSFPVYRNRTNLNEYTLHINGLNGWSGIRRWDIDRPGIGGNFVFTATFCGCSGPYTGCNDCGKYLGCWADLPEWTVTIQRLPPYAKFEAASLTPPGTWNFQSKSTDPEDQPVTEKWDFGDGETSSAAGVVHRYAKPGRYSVSLLVTDVDGLTSRAGQPVNVPAPQPTVSIQLFNKHTGNRLELEEEFDVRVTVTASDDGVGDLTGLAFTGPVLTVPGLFTILRAPADTSLGTLPPGQSKLFTWRLRANQVGQFSLFTSSVAGKDAAGRAVVGSAAEAKGQVTALIVGIQQRPTQFVLGGDNNNDGETNALDRLVELVVGVTNVSKQTVTEVKSVILNDPIQLTSLAEDLNIWLTPVRVPPGDFGTIEPGAEHAVLRTNVYEATDRTYAEAAILLQGKVGNTGVQARGEGIVDVGGEVLLEARFDVVERPYKSGQVVRLFGSLKNVSRFKGRNGTVLSEGKKLGVLVYPTVEGNGALGYFFEKDAGGETPKGPTTFLLDPDQTINLEGILPTLEVPSNTVVRVTYQVAGFVHGDDPNPRRLRPSEIRIVEKPSEGWSAQHEVELGGVPVLNDPWLECPTELSFGGFVSCRLSEGLGNFAGGLVDLGMIVGTGLKELTVGNYRLYVWKCWAIQQALLGLTDPVAKERLAQELLVDLRALKAVGLESLQGVEIAAQSIGPALERTIKDTGRTLESGDLKLISGGIARIVGENIDMPLEALVAARSVRRAMLLREGADSAAKKALQESLERQGRELTQTLDEHAARNALGDLPNSDALPVGINVLKHPRVWRDGYGALKEDIDAFLRIAKEEGVILAFRSRAPKSGEYLKALTHLLKPHGVSIKTVSEIDIRYLGYPRQFEAECVLVEPPIPWVHPLDAHYQPSIDNFLDRFPELKGSDEAAKFLRAQVEERLKFQLKEYPKQLGNFKQYLAEGIDANFKAYKQFEEGSKQQKLASLLLPDSKKNIRAAKVEVYLFKDPYTGGIRRAKRLLMEDGARSGIFKPITGDIDFLAMLRLDGSLPSLVQRVRIYKKMIAAGMQHGESFSYFTKDLREKWLRCCSPTSAGGEGERMLAATPFGQLLTTQFFDNLSVIEGGANNALKVGDGEFAFFGGTMLELNSAERLASEAIPAALRRDAAPYVSVSALARMVGELDAEIDRQGGAPIRMGPDGQPEIYRPTSTSPSPAGNGFAPAPANAAAEARHSLAMATVGGVDFDAELAELKALGWSAERDVAPPGAAGGQWQPATVEEARPGPAGQGLRLAPYTYIIRDLAAGESILPVMSPTDLGLPARSPFFAVGDQVVIDPGGPAEEFATLVSVHPFTLNRPLENLQEVGTTVLFLAGEPNPATLPGALPAQSNLLVWLRADAGLQLNGTNVIGWTDQSRNGFVFTPPTAATRPGWVANSTSGVPAVRFTGGANPILNGNLGRSLTNATIFTLGRFLDTSGGTHYIYSFGTRGLSGRMMTLGRTAGDSAYHFDGAASQSADASLTGAGFHVLSQVFGEALPDRHFLAVDTRAALDTRTTTGREYSAVATNITLGRSPGLGGFVGDLVEWIVYDRVLAASERLQVEEYLRQRAGLAPFFAPGSLALGDWETHEIDLGTLPAATWTLDQGARTVVQSTASDPSFLLSPIALVDAGTTLRARLSAGNGPGFLGFVFGYQDPGHFYLLDWQQAASTHAEYGAAPRGLRLRSFHIAGGGLPTGADLWSSPDSTRVTTLRAQDVPWVAERDYDLQLLLQPGGFEVSVGGGTNVVAAWKIEGEGSAAGRFGYYVYGLAAGRFGQVVLPGAQSFITGLRPEGSDRVVLDWVGGVGPHVIETATDLLRGDWIDAAPATPNQSDAVTVSPGDRFFRVRSVGVPP